MSETVFILGAGASKHAGAPLVKDFLHRAHELRRHRRIGGPQLESDLTSVFDAISSLQDVFAKSYLNLNNVEEVFAAFEMGAQIGRLPGITGEEEIAQLTASLRRIIAATLENTIWYPWYEPHGRVGPTEGYRRLRLAIDALREARGESACSIITFNYDLALDFALVDGGYRPDYGLEPPPKTKKGLIPVLKLHGSLNWAKRRDSGQNTVVPINPELFWGLRHKHIGTEDRRWIPVVEFLPSMAMDNLKIEVDDEPFLVPPSWNKASYQQAVSKVWRRAADELSDAENIFVFGYSLTERDVFFRELFALGSVGRTRIKRFWVFDPAAEAVEKRFRKLLGGDVLARFHPMALEFTHAVGHAKSKLLGPAAQDDRTLAP
jgi:hypothetical protein